MTALSWLMFAVFLAGAREYGIRTPDKALGSWAPVGSFAYVQIVNHAPFPLHVTARAPAVDSVRRFLGIVAAHDSGTFRLPYSDTHVLVAVASQGDTAWADLDASGPTVWRFEIFPGAEHPKQILRIEDYASPRAFQASPWWRMDDAPDWFPTRVAVAGDGTGCPIPIEDVYTPFLGELYGCAYGTWRVARPR